MTNYIQSVNSIYIEDTKTIKSKNTILTRYIPDIEISEGYKLSKFKQILKNLSNTTFKIEDIQKLSEFFTQLNGNLAEDFIIFLQTLKKSTKNKVEIFFLEDESSKGIYINITFSQNTDFKTVDREINRFYNILESINSNLWFVNIGENFNEP